MIRLEDYNLVPAETGIYKIFTSVSSEVYVGSSVDIGNVHTVTITHW